MSILRVAIAAVVASVVVGACTSEPHPSPTRVTLVSEATTKAGGFNVAAENAKPGTRNWALPQNKWASDTQLAGWVDHTSIRPGTPLKLHVTSTERSYTATAYRLGWYGGKMGRQIWRSATLAGVVQPRCALRSDRMVDCSKWSTATTIPTIQWPEGLYLIKLVGIDGKGKYVPVTVRSADSRGRLGALPPDRGYGV